MIIMMIDGPAATEIDRIHACHIQRYRAGTAQHDHCEYSLTACLVQAMRPFIGCEQFALYVVTVPSLLLRWIAHSDPCTKASKCHYPYDQARGPPIVAMASTSLHGILYRTYTVVFRNYWKLLFNLVTTYKPHFFAAIGSLRTSKPHACACVRTGQH